MKRAFHAALCVALVAFPLASFGGLAPDGDGDGVPDAIDNCTDIANPSQCDADNDDFGNSCDCDMTQNNVCDTGDIPPFKTALQGGGPNPAIADINCSGVGDTGDIPPFKALLQQPGRPGPSCCAP